MSHRVGPLGRVKQRLLAKHKGLDGHISLGVGDHLLGKRQGFGLRKGQEGLSRKPGSLKKRLGDLVHQGLEQRQRKLWEILDLALEKWHHWRLKKWHHMALRKDGCLSIGALNHFRLKDRQHHSRLSKRQDILWKGSVRVEPSKRIDKRLWLDKGLELVLVFILDRRRKNL